MKKSTFLLLILLSYLNFYAQSKFSISGTVKDSLSGEDLIGVLIINKASNSAVESNDYGFYSLEVPAGEQKITIVYSGYLTKNITLNITKNETFNIFLNEEKEVVKLKDVVISSQRPDDNVDNVKMSTNTLDIAQIKTLPALFGEVDILKNVQTLPGVQTAGEGSTGFFVRGGGADQNLILMDEAPVYNASHVLGFFSIFNSDVIKNAELYKGNIPAQYGGRLSSLLDIRTKDGNMNKYSGSASLGLISGKLMLEGPIKKDKSSFIISARRSWADVMIRPVPDFKNVVLYFYDMNAKINYKINDKNRIFLAGYFGKDELGLKAFGIKWGNSTGTFRWNHIFNSKVFSNTTLVFSNFNYGLGFNLSGLTFDWTSNLKEFGFKQDFNIFASNKIELNTGFQANYRTFAPGTVKFGGTQGAAFKDIELAHLKAAEEAVYLNADYKLNARWFIQYGIRVSSFQQLGSSSINKYANNNVKTETVIDTINYGNLQNIQTYWGIEPRMGVRYKINESTSIKGSMSRNVQYLHLISNSTVPLPTAMYIPSGKYLRPQYANQIAAGIFKNFKDNMFETSMELYYKKLYDVTDFKDNAQTFLNPTIETQVRQGNGKSYGVELFFKKNKGKLTGWISYTLAKATRIVEDVNDGREFRADYDRRHNANVVFNYELGRKWTMGTAWVLASGRPYTLPVGYSFIDGYKLPLYTERNGYLMPAFHRLDVSFTKKWKKSESSKIEKVFNVSLYNLYNRHNAFFITVEDKTDANGNIIQDQREVKKTWLFSVIPSISYGINF
ncbi:MAG: TonB-dependent receptor [Cytophagales bacterium]